MTNAEQITVSLDWARKLKEAGWPLKAPNPEWPEDKPDWVAGSWYWVSGTLALKCPIFFVECDCGQPDGGPSYWEVDDGTEVFAAPTAEEILRRLPEEIEEKGMTFDLQITNSFRGLANDRVRTWYVAYDDLESLEPGFETCEDTLANAAAAIYCYIASQKLLP